MTIFEFLNKLNKIDSFGGNNWTNLVDFDQTVMDIHTFLQSSENSVVSSDKLCDMMANVKENNPNKGNNGAKKKDQPSDKQMDTNQVPIIPPYMGPQAGYFPPFGIPSQIPPQLYRLRSQVTPPKD